MVGFGISKENIIAFQDDGTVSNPLKDIQDHINRVKKENMAVSYGVKRIEVASPNDGRGQNGRVFETIWVDECNEIDESKVDTMRVSIAEYRCSVFPFLNSQQGTKPIVQPFVSKEDKGTFRNESKHKQSCLKSRKKRKGK